MKTRKIFPGLFYLLALAALSLGACGTFAVGLEGPVTPTPPAPSPSTEEQVVEAPDNVVMAREAALAHLRARPGAVAPPVDLTWQTANVTQQNLVGASAYQFTAEGWTIDVSYPVVALEVTTYTVRVEGQELATPWEGRVDATGNVLPTKEPESVVEVAGWLGHVVGLPPDSPYDDYLALSPDGTGKVGLVGADPALEAEIEGLRDKPEPGKYAHFWGTLRCDVNDYNGCQLEVDRLRYGAVATDPEPIAGWRGTISTSTFNDGLSYVFIMEGDFPVWHGIHSNDPAVLERLDELAGSGTILEVSGELLTGVPDVNGSRIQAERLAVVGQGADPYPGWSRYENEKYGITLRFPSGWSVEEHTGEVGPRGPEAPAVMAIREGYRLVIQFARPNEGLAMGPSGRGAGAIAEGSAVVLLGARVPAHYLIYEGKIKSMFLNESFEDLEFYIQLDPEPGPTIPNYEDLELPPDVLTEVSSILASINVK